MKNSFSVTLFLIGCMLMHSDCCAMGPAKSLNEITKDVRGLKKDVSTLSTKLTQQNDTFGIEVANLRDQLQQQGVTLGNDISELRVQLQQQNEKFEKESTSLLNQLQQKIEELESVSLHENQVVTGVSLFDIYARIDVAVNCFDAGGKDAIHNSLEEVKLLRFDSVDMLQHRLYAVGMLSAFDKFSSMKDWFLSGSNEFVRSAFLDKMANITVYEGNTEHVVSVSFKNLLSRVYKLSNTEVSIDDLYENGCNLIIGDKDFDGSSEENIYRIQSLDVNDICDVIDQFKINDEEIDKLMNDNEISKIVSYEENSKID